ncbi:MAG: hypothetical protein LBR19_09520 [Bifidobacteriaceae bacterium]|jgi:hypothetical protein|nr:hypothetical protein [Bifidobacteriaceae bacterium]
MDKVLKQANPYRVNPADGQTLRAKAELDALVPGARAALAHGEGEPRGIVGLEGSAMPWRRRLALGVAGVCGIVVVAGAAYLGVQQGGNQGEGMAAAGAAAETAAAANEVSEPKAEAAAEQASSQGGAADDAASQESTMLSADSGEATGESATEAQAAETAPDPQPSPPDPTAQPADNGVDNLTDIMADSAALAREDLAPQVLAQVRPAALANLPRTIDSVTTLSVLASNPSFGFCLLLDPATLNPITEADQILSAEFGNCTGIGLDLHAVPSQGDGWKAIEAGQATAKFELIATSLSVVGQDRDDVVATYAAARVYSPAEGQTLESKYIAFYLNDAGQVVWQVFSQLP